MNHLADLNVLVLGLGDSGLAMARWCARHGARVQVWDSRAQPPQAAALAQDAPTATLRSGPLSADDARGLQLVLKSPGLAPHDARIAPLLDAARAFFQQAAQKVRLARSAIALDEQTRCQQFLEIDRDILP